MKGIDTLFLHMYSYGIYSRNGCSLFKGIDTIKSPSMSKPACSSRNECSPFKGIDTLVLVSVVQVLVSVEMDAAR